MSGEITIDINQTQMEFEIEQHSLFHDVDIEITSPVTKFDIEVTTETGLGEVFHNEDFEGKGKKDDPLRLSDEIHDILDSVDEKVDKVHEPNRIYGTDEDGNQTTYDKEDFGKVDDVQVDGVSVVVDKVAHIDLTGKIDHYTELPDITADNANLVVQYVGPTTEQYVENCFYKAIYNSEDPESSYWKRVSVEVINVDGTTIIKGENETLTTIGVKTKSGDTMYDWVGLKADWEAGRANHTIPDEWFCWILDDEDEEAGIANLAQVASTGLFEDLRDIPELPAEKINKNYLLIWNHLTQRLEWVETDIQPPEGEYDPITHTLTIPEGEYDPITRTLTTDSIIPLPEGGEYDPITRTLTIADGEYDDETLTTNAIQPQ